MLTTPARSRSRRLIGLVAVGAAAVTTVVVTATVATPDQVLALPAVSESTAVTVQPTRVLDTRYDVGLTGAFQAGVSRKLAVTGDVVTYFEPTETRTTNTVVPVGATGVLLNVTGIAPTAAGWIAVRPGDATGLPSTSNLNMLPGQIVPNAVTVAVPTTGSGAGQIDITYGPPSGSTVKIIVDIVGYTTNTGLIDLTNRLVALETAGVKGDKGDPGTPAVNAVQIVSVAVSAGNFTSLSAALASITDAGPTNRYVVQIGPGSFTESAKVVRKDHVDIAGSGKAVTTITCACASDAFPSPAMQANSNITSEVRHLTMNTTGTGKFSHGFHAIGGVTSSVSLSHVTFTATGGTQQTYGVYTQAGATPLVLKVRSSPCLATSR